MVANLSASEWLLLDLAKEIISNSIGCKHMALTGSLMLKLRGLPVNRKVEDLDLIVSVEDNLTNVIWEPPYFQVLSTPDYPDLIMYNERTKVRVDVMRSDEFSDIEDKPMDIIEGILCANPFHTILAKEHFAQNDRQDESREKHQKDLLALRKVLPEQVQQWYSSRGSIASFFIHTTNYT